MAKRFHVAGLAASVLVSISLAACVGTDAGDADLSGAGGAGAGGTSFGAAGAGTGVGGTGAGVGGTGTATGGAGTGGGGTACEQPDAACELSTGLRHDCKQRFALGVNYAWHDFAVDFGGMTAWSYGGIAAASATYATEMADMRANGVSVVRWWMYPDFRGDGVTFDASNDASGLGAKTATDIQKALELAEQNDLYLVLTLFSFDNFRPDHDADTGAGVVLVRGMAPMISDATRRAKLIDNIVRPTAQAVAASPYAHRLLGWDVINEPEWAIEASTPGAPSGGAFSPNEELTAVSLANMKALINESAAALKEEYPAGLVSAGWAASKWSWAFNDMTSLDFQQPHIYAWVNTYWPYSTAPADLGYGDKPVVMGEYFLANMPFTSDDSTTFATIIESWFSSGYAGAWSWQYKENKADLPLIKTFADSKGCQVSY